DPSVTAARPQRGAVLRWHNLPEFSSADTAVGLIPIHSICTGISAAGEESVTHYLVIVFWLYTLAGEPS
ncbi:CREB-binding protein, partial [Dissostichus eleginoides]